MIQKNKNFFIKLRSLFFVFPLAFILLSGTALADKTGYQPGTHCAYPSECGQGLTCGTDNTCVPGVAGLTCDNNDDCQAGVICLQGTCQANPGGTVGTGTQPPSTNNTNGTTCTQGTCPTGLCMVNGLCLPPNQYTTGVAASTSLTDLILKVIQGMLAFAGVIAVVFIIIGGYYYMASGGNEENAEKGKSIISNFVIGLVIIILAFTIVTILSATLTGGDKLLQK